MTSMPVLGVSLFAPTQRANFLSGLNNLAQPADMAQNLI
jgi:hypothetical protein